MFIVVILKPSCKIIVIPYRWVSNLNPVRIFNSGIRKYKTHVVFYSKIAGNIPNFDIEITNGNFQPDVDACYYAKVLMAFGK